MGDKKSLVLDVSRGKKIAERCLGCVCAKTLMPFAVCFLQFALNTRDKREGCLSVSEPVKTLRFQFFSKQTCGSSSVCSRRV